MSLSDPWFKLSNATRSPTAIRRTIELVLAGCIRQYQLEARYSWEYASRLLDGASSQFDRYDSKDEQSHICQLVSHMLSLPCPYLLISLYFSQFIDQSLAADPTIPRYDFGFAQQYKDYMNNLATQWNDVPAYVTQLINSVGQDLKTSRQMQDVVNSEWDPMYQVWANYLTQYENTNNAAWKYSISLAFDTTNIKRDFQLQKRSSCSLASGSLSSVTGSQTATSAQASDTNSVTITQPSTISGSASASSAVVCPNNAVDENPPGCVQPSSSSQPFSCSAGSNLGAATYNPATWCGCNTGSGIYPTMTTGTGNAACAYTTLPTNTINPTPVTVVLSTTSSAAFSCTSA